jgi:hypothetical protein
MKKFDKAIDKAGARKSMEKMETVMKQQCKKFKNSQDKRFCYYVGGSDDAAASSLREASKLLKNYMPAEKICERLKKQDAQLCQLTYPKPLDWNTLDLKKMRVKELKNILADWGEQKSCKGCGDKSDYIRKINELKPKYVKADGSPKDDL